MLNRRSILKSILLAPFARLLGRLPAPTIEPELCVWEALPPADPLGHVERARELIMRGMGVSPQTVILPADGQIWTGDVMVYDTSGNVRPMKRQTGTPFGVALESAADKEPVRIQLL